MISVMVRLDCSNPELLLPPPSRMMVALKLLELEFATVACFWYVQTSSPSALCVTKLGDPKASTTCCCVVVFFFRVRLTCPAVRLFLSVVWVGWLAQALSKPRQMPSVMN